MIVKRELLFILKKCIYRLSQIEEKRCIFCTKYYKTKLQLMKKWLTVYEKNGCIKIVKRGLHLILKK